MIFNKTTRITTLIILFPLITLLLYGALSHLFFFYIKKIDTEHELIRYETVLLDARKENLVEKVETLTRFIRYYNYKSGDKIKKDVKSVIYIANKMANNIYHEYKNKLSEDEIKSLIITSLSRITFEANIGYLFMLDTKGDVYIHPDKNIVGTNIINLRDVNGKYLVKEFLSVLEGHGEGYVDYYWNIPNHDKKDVFYKISFVKMLEMYGWYIGAGEYLKYMTKQVSEEILEYISDNAYFKGGYFFVSDSKNRIVYHPKKNNKEDLKGLRLEGIYEDDEKIAYTAYVAEYDWYITAVQNLKGVRENIDKKKKQSASIISKDIRTNFYLIISMWFLSLLFSVYLSSIVNKRLREYERQLGETNNRLIFQSRQALIGELFSMIAHQWRQPINKIASILALLRFNISSDKPDYNVLDERFQEIEDSVEFMSDTIDDFRTFYQPKEGAESSNLKLLVHKSIDFLSGSIRKKDITVLAELDDVECEMHGNEFLQVMINLIKNAADAVGQRGIIRIKLYKEKSGVIILVEDNGVGIKPELVSKIFDPYYSTKTDSMGLGLYMSKMIIERHLRGSISVKPLINGTEFRLKLTCTHK